MLKKKYKEVVINERFSFKPYEYGWELVDKSVSVGHSKRRSYHRNLENMAKWISEELVKEEFEEEKSLSDLISSFKKIEKSVHNLIKEKAQ